MDHLQHQQCRVQRRGQPDDCTAAGCGQCAVDDGHRPPTGRSRPASRSRAGARTRRTGPHGWGTRYRGTRTSVPPSATPPTRPPRPPAEEGPSRWNRREAWRPPRAWSPRRPRPPTRRSSVRGGRSAPGSRGGSRCPGVTARSSRTGGGWRGHRAPPSRCVRPRPTTGGAGTGSGARRGAGRRSISPGAVRGRLWSGADVQSPRACFTSSARDVSSQVNSFSARPKWPYAAVFR